MSLAELKQGVEALTADERTELRAHLKLLELRQDREWQDEMFRRARLIAAGDRHSKEEILRAIAEQSRQTS